jgi:hypothetical protein
MTKSVFVVALAAGLLLTALGARAEEPTTKVAVSPTLYVGKFQPVEHAHSGFGPLHAHAWKRSSRA